MSLTGSFRVAPPRPAATDGASPERRAALLARGVASCRRGSGPYALSHVSAAAVHGLPVPLHLTGTAWITVPNDPGASTHYDHLLREEVATLPPAHVVTLAGM